MCDTKMLNNSKTVDHKRPHRLQSAIKGQKKGCDYLYNHKWLHYFFLQNHGLNTIPIASYVESAKLKCVSCLCRWNRRTVQQIQRCGVKSSCKSSKSHQLRLQVCRCNGRLLLETLTVQRKSSRRMSIRLAVSRCIIFDRMCSKLNDDDDDDDDDYKSTR